MPRIRKTTDENLVTYSVLDREVSASDFLKDPELLKDNLPQPYRRIDKILQDLLEDVWNILENNDNVRKIEQSKPRAKKFTVASVLEGLESFNCMSLSSDDFNEFLFIGSNGFIQCVDVSTMSVIDKFDFSKLVSDFNKNITSIYTAVLKQNAHLVVSISDFGHVFMHVFVIDKFYAVQSIILEPEADRKFIYRKCEISKNCDYLAFFVEAKSNLSDCLIEIYKCPKELWFQTFETIENKNQPESVSNAEFSETPTLAKPTCTCKVKPPVNQFKFQQGNNQNLPQLFKQLESSQDLVGTGINTVLTRTQFELKAQFAEKVFNIKLTDDTFNQLNGNRNFDFPSNKVNADFMFFPSNKIIQSQAGDNQDNLVSIGVCWNNQSQVHFYPLAKVNKELESKVEYTIPFSSQITHLQTSKCNNLLLISLRNNNVVVFDLNMGVERTCVHLPSSEYVKQIYFLPILVSNKSLLIENTTQLKIETQIVCLTSNGNLYLIDCTFNSTKKPQLIFSPKLTDKDDKLVYMAPLKNLPNLLLVVGETKKIFVFDMQKSQIMCELDQSKYPIDPDQIQFGFSSKSHQLFTNGKFDVKTNILCHTLKSVEALDNCLNVICSLLPTCLPLNASLNDRVKILLKNKAEEHRQRTERLKNVWNELGQQRNNTKKRLE